MAKRDNTEMQEQAGTKLEDYIVPAKIDAFVRHYKPCDSEEMAEEVFTDARLREFFKAWPCGLGDPLAIYMARLDHEGYQMDVSITGEPALFVVERY